MAEICFTDFLKQVWRLSQENMQNANKDTFLRLIDYIFQNTRHLQENEKVDEMFLHTLIKCIQRNADTIGNYEIEDKITYLENLIEMKNGTCIWDPQQAPKGWSCSICYSRGESHLCKKTSCGHYFHFHCMKKWERREKNCPICKTEFLKK